MKTYLRLLILMNVLMGGLSYGMEATEQDHGVQSSGEHQGTIVIPRSKLDSALQVYSFTPTEAVENVEYGWLLLLECTDRVFVQIHKADNDVLLSFIDKDGLRKLPNGLYYCESKQGVKNHARGKRFVYMNGQYCHHTNLADAWNSSRHSKYPTERMAKYVATLSKESEGTAKVEQPSKQEATKTESKKIEKEEEVESCCVCFDEPLTAMLECGHSFGECVKKWVFEHRKCPICNSNVKVGYVKLKK